MQLSDLFFRYNKFPLKLILTTLRACSSANDKIFKVSKGSHVIPNRKTSIGASQKIDAKVFEAVKFKDKVEKRNYAIITKSKDPEIFGDMEDFIVEETFHGNLGEHSSAHEDCELVFPMNRNYHTPDDYLKGMKDLVKEKKLKEALELFDDMKRYHVPVILPHYTFMIGACGRAGYTGMAFKLLRQMTDKGLKPTPATLTGLFNSCAESPDSTYGLKKATFLKEKVRMKSWEVTVPTYHAMIKAFGRCGDIKTAFEIVDEMIESECQVSVETYNALLISCISDRDAGFTHVIEVWRKMISKRLCPDIYTFNLLLRAVRDCGAGPEEVSCNLLHHWSSCSTHLFSSKKKVLSREDVLSLPLLTDQNTKLLSHPLFHGDGNGLFQKNTTSRESERITENEKFSTETNAAEDGTSPSFSGNNFVLHNVFNLLLPRPLNGPKFIDLKNIRNPPDRLLLIGGMKGFLELMQKVNVIPDMKTFTMLLKILPNSTSCENELLALMDSYRIKPDVDFFNMLIKKRNFRKDFKAAKEVLILIAKQELCPNIMTFGILALGCTRKKEGLQLLSEIKKLGFCPNIEIFGALLNAARRSVDFEYICTLMKVMRKEHIKPSPQFLQMLEDSKNMAHDEILAVEHHEKCGNLSFTEKSYNEFCELYEHWLKTTDVEEQCDRWYECKA